MHPWQARVVLAIPRAMGATTCIGRACIGGAHLQCRLGTPPCLRGPGLCLLMGGTLTLTLIGAAPGDGRQEKEGLQAKATMARRVLEQQRLQWAPVPHGSAP